MSYMTFSALWKKTPPKIVFLQTVSAPRFKAVVFQHSIVDRFHISPTLPLRSAHQLNNVLYHYLNPDCQLK